MSHNWGDFFGFTVAKDLICMALDSALKGRQIQAQGVALR
jgi:hypothetical protein